MNRLIQQEAYRTTGMPHTADPPPRSQMYCDPDNRFTILAHETPSLEALLRMDTYSAAIAYVRGDFSVTGDVCAAVEFFVNNTRSVVRKGWFTLLAHLGRVSISSLTANRRAVARDIGFHYDLSNDFYQLFLDPWMQYEAGTFTAPECTLEQAQLKKLANICDKIELLPKHRMLDIGCGWGGLLAFAGERRGIQGCGCTLSMQQQQFAQCMLERKGLAGRIEVRRTDYRDVVGTYDRVTSIGMFEHVGRRHLLKYFEKIRSLLSPDGLFLNRGIVRPASMSDGPETLFLQRRVFPGGDLPHLADVVRAAEIAGLEVESLEDYRIDYALTCKAWVARLRENVAKCVLLVGDRAYRTWLLFLGASAVNFEAGLVDAVEIVFRPRSRRTVLLSHLKV